MSSRKPNELTALEAARAMEEGTLSAQALVQACLDRIAERNAVVQAFVATDAQAALREARAADASRTGVLRGIPFAVKDIIETRELPTAYGSPIHEGHRPAVDAGSVALAREQGAVLLGKVVTSEFATQTPGPTRNPLDPSRTPGGSSSGSAAAVADCMVPVALGTQTTGSIIRPSSYCGVVGYKPTHGFLSAAGVKALSPLQDTVGVLARTVADTAFFAFGLHGARPVHEDAAGMRIALCESSQWTHCSPAMVSAVEGAAGTLERSGVAIRRARVPQALEDLVDVQGKLVAYEARHALADERTHHLPRMSERLRQRMAAVEDITPMEYLALRRQVMDARAGLDALFGDADALLYPAADGEAEVGHANSGSPRFGAIWTVLGLPCVCVPAGRGPSGMPLGVQVIGRFGDDLGVLAIADAVSAMLQPRLS
jgi:Asp-tRNA(Asn)/Glu-tRNA(Gln) amidotransferase A subunit family amidase